MNHKIELRHLRYFVTVAEELNLTRAAELLHTVQPSLGRQIHLLEEYLGVPLLRREGRKMELTEAGGTLLTESRILLQEFDSMLERVQSAGRIAAGKLVVGFFHGGEWRVFPRVLPLIRSQCPSLELQLRGLAPPEQIVALRNRTIDVGFLRGPISEPKITTEWVLSDQILAMIPAQHSLAKLKRVSLQKLADLPFVVMRWSTAPSLHELVYSLGAKAGVKFRTVLETESILATLSAVGAGEGFSLLPAYIGEMLPKTVVARQLALTPTPTTDLFAAYLTGNTNPMLKLFLTQLHDCLREAETIELTSKH